jgi:hypothetical protein
LDKLVYVQIRGNSHRKSPKIEGFWGMNLEKTQDLIDELGLFCKKMFFGLYRGSAAGGLQS